MEGLFFISAVLAPPYLVWGCRQREPFFSWKMCPSFSLRASLELKDSGAGRYSQNDLVQVLHITDVETEVQRGQFTDLGSHSPFEALWGAASSSQGSC